MESLLREMASVIWITLAAGVLCAQPEQVSADMLRIRSEQVTAARFPDADTVWLELNQKVRYEPDGTSVSWEDECIKILTEKGRREEAAQEASYNETYGTLSILKVEIIKPDGRIIPVDLAANVKTATDNRAMDVNIYDPAQKKIVIQRPGLEVGDLIRTLSVSKQTKARVPNTFADLTLLQYTSPIMHAVYEVSAPPDRPLVHRRLLNEIPGTVRFTDALQEDGRMLYRWETADVPQIHPEPRMPSIYTQVQRVIVSTSPGWKDLSKWYWELSAPHLKVTPAISEKVAELTKDCATGGEKIQALFKFVSQEIRYMGIIAESEAPGYEPHDAALTFDNRYGVCRDKAALLAAMLREAGIEGFPVLIHAGARMDPDVPVPYFNHAITAALAEDGSYVLMDPTDEQTRELFPAYLCNKSYLVARPDGDVLRTSEVYPASRNMAQFETAGELLPDNTLTLSTTITLHGLNDNIYRSALLNRPAPDRRRLFEGLVKRLFPGAELTAFDHEPADLQNTARPLALTLSVRVPDYGARNEQGITVFPMPWFSQGFGAVNFLVDSLSLETRAYDLELPSTAGLRETVSLRGLGAAGQPAYLPEAFRIDIPGVRYDRSIEADPAKGELKAERFFALTNQDYSPEDYLGLRKAAGDIRFDLRRDPRFTLSAAQDADVEILSAETEITLHSRSSWTVDRKQRTRILTYAGKKEQAELSFTFNPARETFDLIRAAVIAPDGSEKRIQPREINVMDAEWAAEAPRYPAGKILVASLPGVEVGSVTLQETRTTVTNGAFFSFDYAFGAFSPVAAEKLKVTLPLALADSFACRATLFNDLGAEQVSSVVYTNAAAATVSYFWSSDPRRATRREEALPPAWYYRPSVIASCGNWQAYSQTLEALLKPLRKGNKAARLHARAITKGLKTPEAKIKAVRDDVARAIRPAGPGFLDLPFLTASTPDATLADGYGHALDRALLLEAMLRAAGLEAEIVFASPSKAAYSFLTDRERDIPQIRRYSQPRVIVNAGRDRWITLNDTDQYAQLGATPSDTCPYLAPGGDTGAIAVPECLRDRGENETTLILDPNGDAIISRKDFYHGAAAGPFRKLYAEMTPENRKRHALGLVTAIDPAAVPASELVTDLRAFPGMRMYSAAVAKYAVRDGQTMTLEIPDVALDLAPLRADQRFEDIYLSADTTATATWNVYFPPHVKRIAMRPEPFSWELPGGAGTLAFTCREARNFRNDTIHLVFTRTLTLKPGILGRELYPALLEMNRRLNRPAMSLIMAEF